LFLKLLITLPNLGLKVGREPCLQNPGADLRSARFQGAQIFGIQLLDAFLDALGQAAVVAKPPGTRMPAAARPPIISPREAFLPPT
jgi:hypothetical protein